MEESGLVGMNEEVNEINLLNEVLKQRDSFPMRSSQYSPLVLAYIGDAVYEIVVRTKIVHRGNAPVNRMHIQAREYVKAAAQAAMSLDILPLLNKKELAVFKRGRNAKSATIPKNAKLIDYKNATGFEALIGYLYLENNMKRLLFLIEKGFEAKEKEKE